MPFFSIIIPLYNKETFISETLKSIAKQSFTDYEVIIINDGSTDNSLSVVQQLKSEKIKVFQQKNQGVSAARNHGISVAKGQFIALLDADDTWYINHLEELKKQINKFPNAGLYCNNYEILYSKSVKRNATFNFAYQKNCLIVKDFFKASIINSVAWTSAVAFSKEKFNSIGGFNTTLNTCEDLDLWLRLALKHDVAFNPTITMSYKTYITDSLTKNENNRVREAFLTNFSKAEHTNASLKLYLDINRYALAIRCKILKENGIYARMKAQILKENINYKQRLLLKMPRVILIISKKIQKKLVSKGIYLTAFK